MLHLCDKNHTMPFNRIHLQVVDSTNACLSEAFKQGELQEETALIADYQERGRGQGGHHWDSPMGENLLLSVLLLPAFLSAPEQFQLSRVTSLAIADTLLQHSVDPVIKWPNDILVGGRKISGILIENGITGRHISHSIVGIGLNLNQVIFPEYPVPPTSVKLETGREADRDSMAGNLLTSLEKRYLQLSSGKTKALEEEYLLRMYQLNEPARYRSGGENFTGIIRGVDRSGELLVERQGRIGNYGFQEIEYISS